MALLDLGLSPNSVRHSADQQKRYKGPTPRFTCHVVGMLTPLEKKRAPYQSWIVSVTSGQYPEFTHARLEDRV